jgi:hypothetical protein
MDLAAGSAIASPTPARFAPHCSSRSSDPWASPSLLEAAPCIALGALAGNLIRGGPELEPDFAFRFCARVGLARAAQRPAGWAVEGSVAPGEPAREGRTALTRRSRRTVQLVYRMCRAVFALMLHRQALACCYAGASMLICWYAGVLRCGDAGRLLRSTSTLLSLSLSLPFLLRSCPPPATDRSLQVCAHDPRPCLRRCSVPRA